MSSILMLTRNLRIVVFRTSNMYTKFILNKNDVISIIALLAALRAEVKDIKDPKTRDEILDFMYENFDADDVAIFNSINNIMDNVKCLEFEM